MRVNQTATATLSTRYFHTDHLGSVSVLTDETGTVVERLSYDAWGKRRFANGTDDPSGSITSQSTRGFTGEEELSVSGLLHLNGRVYDPLLARFTSADPTVTDPLNPQGWNRYSYVGNDPLAFTDPNGFSWLSSFFHSVTNFIRNTPIVQATASGLASVAGGGKFANGAATGGFGYLVALGPASSQASGSASGDPLDANAAQLSRLPDGRVIVEGADPSYIMRRLSA
jgi:RHS repeat-associated protein